MAVAQVMRLRDENEALMETLVRTKVELAETQGAVAGCPASAVFFYLTAPVLLQDWTWPSAPSILIVSHQRVASSVP